jgi:hypothetical protein
LGRGKGRKKTTKSHGKEEVKQGDDGEPIDFLNYVKKGHWAKDYWSKPKKKDKAHLAQTEEEEPVLFLVSTNTI